MTALLQTSSTSFWWERNDLHYINNRLFFSGCDVGAIAVGAKEPLYLYSAERIKANLARLLDALSETGCRHRVYYAMKANRYLPLLALLSRSRQCGVDVCSPYELDRALACGFAAKDISFTGTAVSNNDLNRLLAQSAPTINCDTISMIRRIGQRAPGREIGVRVNPAIGASYGNSERLSYAGQKTTKFGIYAQQWEQALAAASAHDLKITTLHFHAGCGYLNEQLGQWESALCAALALLDDLPDIHTVNIGGGLGLPHRSSDAPLDLERWSAILRRHFEGRDLTIAVEPGDYLVKDAGMLVLSVTDVEQKADTLFAFVEGGFNLHPEPVFYDLPCEPAACLLHNDEVSNWRDVTIAGNINEAHDIWAENVSMPLPREGDYIAFLNAGGYGAAMSSNHCMRGSYKELLI